MRHKNFVELAAASGHSVAPLPHMPAPIQAIPNPMIPMPGFPMPGMGFPMMPGMPNFHLPPMMPQAPSHQR